MSAKISSLCSSGDPELGPRHANGKWRALVGWNHQDDTEDGLKAGKVWCWVSDQPAKFQVYDQNFNRGGKGEVRFCGVANFTMVRMFHPYWSLTSSLGISTRVPLDGESEDKKKCREKYHQLIRRHRISLHLPVDDDPVEDVDDTVQVPVELEASLVVEHEKEAQDDNVAQPTVVLPPKENAPGWASEHPMIVHDGETVGAEAVRSSPLSQLVKLNAEDPYHRNALSANNSSIKRRRQGNATGRDRHSRLRRNARSTSRGRRSSHTRSHSPQTGHGRLSRREGSSTSSSVKSEMDTDYPRLTDMFRQRKPRHSSARLATEQSSRCATISDIDDEMDDSLFIPETDKMISPDMDQVKNEDELEGLRRVRESSGFSDLLTVGNCSYNPIVVD